MNLNCSRETLLNYINIVNKAVSNRTTLPILECILLTTTTEGLVLTSTDLELGIKTAPIPAEITETGSVALEAKLFTEIIRRVSGDTVSIITDSNHAAVITCGFSEFKIVGQSGDDFPSLPTVEKKNQCVLLQNNLKNMIRQTIFSISQDESKPVLMGEYFEMKKKEISVVSIDGFRISYRCCLFEEGTTENNVIVPGKTLTELQKILGQEEERVSIYTTDKHIMFDLGDSTVVSRLIEGDYVKYEQNFQEDYKTKVIVKRNDFIQALERASLVSRDNRKTPVKLDISGDRIIITSNGDMGTACEEIAVETQGCHMDIAFNPKYFIDALKVIEEEQVLLLFTTSLSPCIIRPLEGESFKYLILPLRL